MEMRERIFISWFVQTGNTRREVTTYIPNESDGKRFLENEWRPESTKDYAPETARIYAVLRDSRDGVSWQIATVKLVVVPEVEESGRRR